MEPLEQNKLNTLAPIILGIVVVIVSLVLFFIFKGGTSTLQSVEKVAQVVATSTTPVVPDGLVSNTNANKIFDEATLGATFTYPADWYYTMNTYPSQQLVCLNPVGKSGDCSILLTNSVNTTLEERYLATSKLFSKVHVEESQIMIAQEVGKLMTISGWELGREGNTRVLFFQKNGFVYNISANFGYESVFDLIVKNLSISTSSPVLVL